jgi:hypothetical protein
MKAHIACACCLLVAAGAVWSAPWGGQVAACEKAARFGYTDSLCEKGLLDIPAIPRLASPDATPQAAATDTNQAADGAATQWEIYRQSERANRRAWENYRTWNPVSPLNPFIAYPGAEWSPFNVPHFRLQPPPPPPQASKH